MRKSPNWTDEDVARLTDLWERGGHTASQISEILGNKTRSAVIGKAHRLGLSSRPSPIKKKTVRPGEGRAKRAQRPRQREHNMPPKPRYTPQIMRVDRAKAAVTAYPAPAGYEGPTCQWPMWDHHERATHEYCGGVCVPGRPYCEAHNVVSASAIGIAGV